MSVHAGQWFEIGQRLVPVIVKAGLGICGIGGQGGCPAPVALNAWPSLMAICPATHAVNGALAMLCSGSQTAAHYEGSSSCIAWLVRVIVLVVSSVADCSVSQVYGCALACLVTCLHALVLQQVLRFFLNM
jgi:cation transporter-like permease